MNRSERWLCFFADRELVGYLLFLIYVGVTDTEREEGRFLCVICRTPPLCLNRERRRVFLFLSFY